MILPHLVSVSTVLGLALPAIANPVPMSNSSPFENLENCTASTCSFLQITSDDRLNLSTVRNIAESVAAQLAARKKLGGNDSFPYVTVPGRAKGRIRVTLPKKKKEGILMGNGLKKGNGTILTANGPKKEEGIPSVTVPKKENGTISTVNVPKKEDHSIPSVTLPTVGNHRLPSLTILKKVLRPIFKIVVPHRRILIKLGNARPKKCEEEAVDTADEKCGQDPEEAVDEADEKCGQDPEEDDDTEDVEEENDTKDVEEDDDIEDVEECDCDYTEDAEEDDDTSDAEKDNGAKAVDEDVLFAKQADALEKKFASQNARGTCRRQRICKPGKACYRRLFCLGGTPRKLVTLKKLQSRE
jgi:hypothetical protein